MINCRRLAILDLLKSCESEADRELIADNMFLPSHAMKNYENPDNPDSPVWIGKLSELSRFICEKIMAVHTKCIDKASRNMLNQSADVVQFRSSPDIKAMFDEIAAKKAELEGPATPPPQAVGPADVAVEAGHAEDGTGADNEEEHELTQEEAMKVHIASWKARARNMWSPTIRFKVVPCLARTCSIQSVLRPGNRLAGGFRG